jgi:hypothetical protein
MPSQLYNLPFGTPLSLPHYITKHGAESREDEEVNGMVGRCFESKKQAYEDNCQKATRVAFAI